MEGDRQCVLDGTRERLYDTGKRYNKSAAARPTVPPMCDAVTRHSLQRSIRTGPRQGAMHFCEPVLASVVCSQGLSLTSPIRFPPFLCSGTDRYPLHLETFSGLSTALTMRSRNSSESAFPSHRRKGKSMCRGTRSFIIL
jgi:hypothetical protein